MTLSTKLALVDVVVSCTAGLLLLDCRQNSLADPLGPETCMEWWTVNGGGAGFVVGFESWAGGLPGARTPLCPHSSLLNLSAITLQNLLRPPNPPSSPNLPQSLHLPIMSFGKTDELAINTIRTLAVCTAPPSSPSSPLPRYRIFFSTIKYANRTTPCMHSTISIADSRALLDRCHLCGQLWPSGRAHGHGPGGPRPVQQVHDFQP